MDPRYFHELPESERDPREVCKGEKYDKYSLYRVKYLKDKRFTSWVIQNSTPPYHFKLELRPGPPPVEPFHLAYNPRYVNKLDQIQVDYVRSMLVEKRAKESLEYVIVKNKREVIQFYFTLDNKNDAKLFYDYIIDSNAHPSIVCDENVFAFYLATGKYPHVKNFRKNIRGNGNQV